MVDDVAEQFNEAVRRATHYIQLENSRLRQTEDEYRRLKCMLSVIQEQDILTETVTITITKADMVKGKDWIEIMKLAAKK